MTVSKTKQDKRVAAGYCCLCPDSTPPDEKKLESSRFCKRHLKYFADYNKLWRSENRPAKKIHKCSICRRTDHDRSKCDDPRAVQWRVQLKPN